MKILIFRWKAYSDRFLEKNIKKLGIAVDIYEDYRVIMEDEGIFEDILKNVHKGYDAVISYNYFKLISIACQMCSIPYISWTQDSPMLSLFDASVYFDTNYFFCFDSEQCEGLKQRGVDNVHYYPLLVDADELYSTANNLSDEDKKKYSADISFVGSLYSEKNMLSTIEPLPDYIKGYLRGFEETQLQVPDIRFSQMKIAENVAEWLKENLVFMGTNESQIDYLEMVNNLIDREVTVMERRRMLESMQYMDFKLFTTSDTREFPYIKNCGTVDYYFQMPKVFALSKVNLNVTLRSIRMGIPLRVLDVLACGGFLLTNYQPDMQMYFEEGKNIVTFNNLHEMKEKAEYYLNHESERKKIAMEGRKVVKDNFSFCKRLKDMFKIVGIR